MYLGGGWFTHASTVKNEVVYSNLFTSPYYKKRLRICRRYLPSSTTRRASVPVRKPWRPKVNPRRQIQRSANIARRKSQNNAGNRAIVIRAPMKEIEQSSAGSNFYIQAGSFIGNPSNDLLYAITRHGFNYKLIQFNTEGRHISKLLIGPYWTREQASTELERVRREIKKDAFIAEIR